MYKNIKRYQKYKKLTTTICTPELVTLTVALHVLRGPNTQPHTDDCCQQVRTCLTT